MDTERATLFVEEEHSPEYYKIKDYYEKGLWGIKAVRNAVAKGKIKDWEFEEITGIPYEA